MKLPDRVGPLESLLVTGVAASAETAGVTVTALTADSRSVKPGTLFAALPGTRANGLDFVAGAVANGAVAVLVPADAELADPGVPVLRASDARRALALMAARFYGPMPGTAVAVTGTSGKTSVAEFTRQIFAGLGYAAASVGTLGVVSPAGSEYGSLTTPDQVTLAGLLGGLAEQGVTHLAFEASSHGLDQRRLDGVELTAAAFTNLGRDHLDYHADVEAYFQAKMRLFEVLTPPGASVVINADGARAGDVVAVARRRGQNVMTVGRAGETLRLANSVASGFAQTLEIAVGSRSVSVDLPLPGAYQVENALVAAGLAMATGADASDALAQLARLKGVPGRLEVIGQARGGLAVVDYAHKPEALEAALAALRPFATGRLICVVGCGGDRDKGKRPIMGRIAGLHADVAIVTDDNPRSEDPALIRQAIMSGSPELREIGDREEAIRAAVGMMAGGDVVLVAGKGHETGQIIGDTVLPFSDRDCLAQALEALR